MNSYIMINVQIFSAKMYTSEKNISMRHKLNNNKQSVANSFKKSLDFLNITKSIYIPILIHSITKLTWYELIENMVFIKYLVCLLQ